MPPVTPAYTLARSLVQPFLLLQLQQCVQSSQRFGGLLIVDPLRFTHHAKEVRNHVTGYGN